eukprot:2445624-Rhodomonas_salina.1
MDRESARGSVTEKAGEGEKQEGEREREGGREGKIRWRYRRTTGAKGMTYVAPPPSQRTRQVKHEKKT